MKPDHWLDLFLDSLGSIFSWLSVILLAIAKFLGGRLLKKLEEFEVQLKKVNHDVANIRGQREGVNSAVLDSIAHIHKRIDESDALTAERFSAIDDSLALLTKILSSKTT